MSECRMSDMAGVGEERERDSLDKQTEEEVIQRRGGGGGGGRESTREINVQERLSC